MLAKEPLWEPNWPRPMANIMPIVPAQSWSLRGVFQKPAFMGRCSMIRHDWANGGSFEAFFTQ